MRKVLSVGLIVATVLATIAAPAQAEDTGSIAGRFTENGVPVVGATVSAQPESGSGGGAASTDSNGEYRIDGLTPRKYRVSFYAGDGPVQYAFGKTSYSNADLITVTAGAVSTVDDTRLPTGVIQGTFNGPDSQTRVFFTPEYGSGGEHHSGYVSGGQFTARLFPGRYRIGFVISGSDLSSGPYIQYAGGTDVQSAGTIFTVTAGGSTTVTESMLPTGRMEGRFTDAAGNGMANVEVNISRDDLPMGPSAHTDANGNYSFPYMRVSPNWRVLFRSNALDFRQWAVGKVNQEDADAIAITQGGTTVVNDSRLATGTVKVTAREAVTGLPVDKFQASLGNAGFGETVTGGSVVIQSVPLGTHPVSVWAYGYEYADETKTVTVTPGQQSEVTIDLAPTTRIEALAVDAVTGAPVEDVCLIPAKPERFVLPGEHCGEFTTSGPSGRVMLEIYEPGSYQLMAFPMGPQGYGAQWVGPTSGTGVQHGAKLVQVQAGQQAKLTNIKLDRAGTITGRVTSPSGTPASGAMVSLGEVSRSGPGPGAYFADDQGRYTITDLGPYQWPLMFSGNTPEMGIQWSGQRAHRLTAQRITVRSGQSTTYDFRYRTPAQITTKPGVTGQCEIEAFNLFTGDSAGTTWSEDCSKPLTLTITGPQWVKLSVYYFDGEEWVSRLYDVRFVWQSQPPQTGAVGHRS